MANAQDALYILSPFDTLFERVGVVMGWLVEGTVDLATLDRALGSVVRKWPMLAGRLETHDVEGNQKLYRVRVPLSGVAEDYARYTLTSSSSPYPLSKYMALPIPLASDSLPHELFMQPKAPTLTTQWTNGKLPLLHWHVTWFDRYDDSGKKRPFSCIGVTFPHALFDGLGIARVVHAVEAELLGREWEPPSIVLEPGVNKDLLEATLDRAADEQFAKTGQTHGSSEYHATGLVTTWWVFMYFLWAIWQEKWHGGRRRLLLMPAEAFGKLVDETRAAAAKEQGDKPEDGRVQLTRGDILAAFVFKNTFCDGYLPPESIVSMSSLASLRRPTFFSGALATYPHNCVIPLPYPLYTMRKLEDMTIPTLATQFAEARIEFKQEEALLSREVLRRGAREKLSSIPFDTRARESMSFSNMVIANIVNIDWTGAGRNPGDVSRTVCRYKTLFPNPQMQVANTVVAAGYLDDGTMVMDVYFVKRRLKLLEGAIAKLVEEAER
ncbi:unnamed protein product [Cyclocybe aegerita]|uniref:Uncharacterized protein n=1 Tax=Cyclocybe aegerita TaxID=1973307 RepID=A0A8S0XQP6_CYCAE|nr:unnamed protein product [Cyclocybe aegerita]